jgi:hypothetical protein
MKAFCSDGQGGRIQVAARACSGEIFADMLIYGTKDCLALSEELREAVLKHGVMHHRCSPIFLL